MTGTKPTTDTIAAISTPPGRGGIGIVRLSGPEAASIAAQLVRLRQPLEHGRARLADVLDSADRERKLLCTFSGETKDGHAVQQEFSGDYDEAFEKLNDAQREAVTAPPGHQLVLAGAGSGKTRVLVQRIAWLIQVENLSPHNILAVTFTNKSAAEMRYRLEVILEMPTQLPVRQMWVGTFHGLAHRLLKLHWKEAGLPENFQILDSDDQLRLVKQLIQSEGLDSQKWPSRVVRKIPSTAFSKKER